MEKRSECNEAIYITDTRKSYFLIFIYGTHYNQSTNLDRGQILRTILQGMHSRRNEKSKRQESWYISLKRDIDWLSDCKILRSRYNW
jgi:hypothetical protein